MVDILDRVDQKHYFPLCMIAAAVLSLVSSSILWLTGNLYWKMPFPWWKLPLGIAILALLPQLLSGIVGAYAFLKYFDGDWSDVDEKAIVSETSDNDPRE